MPFQQQVLAALALFRSFSAVQALPQQFSSCVSVIVGTPAAFSSATSTTIIEATQSAFTSYATGVSTVTKVIGQPGLQTAATSTATLAPGESGYQVTPVVSQPSQYSTALTSFVTLPANGTPYTSFLTSGSIVTPVVGQDAPYQTASTITSAIPANSAAFTSHVTNGMIITPIVGQPNPYSIAPTSISLCLPMLLLILRI